MIEIKNEGYEEETPQQPEIRKSKLSELAQKVKGVFIPEEENRQPKESNPDVKPRGKKKMLHVMLGQHNPDMRKGLDSVFECKHIDWTENFTFKEKEPVKEVDKRTSDLQMVHGFDPRNPSGEIRRVVKPADLPTDENETSTEFDVKLLKLFYEFRPDIVFIHTQKGGIISLDSIREMRKTAKIINFTGDVRWPIPPFYKKIGKDIDITLFTNMEDVLELERLGIPSGFLQVGFDSKLFSPDGPINEKAPEIVFLGSNYGRMFPLSEQRELLVKTLKDVFGNKFGVYGTGWGELGDGVLATYDEEGSMYRGCKIAISLSHFDRTKYASDRLFRIMGSGAFCISHEYKAMQEDFISGEDLETFQSVNELIAKIKFYLDPENEATRKEIAASGCKVARTNFTWHYFAENLAEVVAHLPVKQWK